MQINWKIALFSTASFVLFTWLGTWQLERAEAKKASISLETFRQAQPPVSITTIAADNVAVAGLKVRLEGQYDKSALFLLDNVVLEGKVGFEVLVPFQDVSGVTVIVDRGFVPMGRTRQDAPAIPPLTLTPVAVGSLYTSPAGTEGQPEPVPGATILQSFSPAVIGDALDRPVYPWLVRLDEQDANALPRYWPTTVMSPERHTGYAVQWFLMAVAVLIAFGFATFKRQEEKHA